MTKNLAPENPWALMRRHTPARIGLQTAGAAIATREHLAFQLAHARARDAVHDALNPAPLIEALRVRGLNPRHLHSAAGDRRRYLLRPDLGRCLDTASRESLIKPESRCDMAVIIADGLSARAVAAHALPLLDLVLPALNWNVAAAVVEQGRVAIGDEIGAMLGADIVAVLIGERPGLSSPDSMGVYITWSPKIGRKDSERNCISNIRPEGLGYAEAAAKLIYLLKQARARGVTGIALKEDATPPAPALPV